MTDLLTAINVTREVRLTECGRVRRQLLQAAGGAAQRQAAARIWRRDVDCALQFDP